MGPIRTTRHSLTINGAPVTIQNGSFSYALTLATGLNTITTIAMDNAGNTTTDVRGIIFYSRGDLNYSGTVDLADAILALKVLTGVPLPVNVTIHKESDANGDGKIGIAEVIYIMQKAAGLR